MVLPTPVEPVPFTSSDIGNIEQVHLDTLNSTAVQYFDTSFEQVLFKDYRYTNYIDTLTYNNEIARNLYSTFDAYSIFQGVSWYRSDQETSFSRGIFTQNPQTLGLSGWLCTYANSDYTCTTYYFDLPEDNQNIQDYQLDLSQQDSTEQYTPWNNEEGVWQCAVSISYSLRDSVECTAQLARNQSSGYYEIPALYRYIKNDTEYQQYGFAWDSSTDQQIWFDFGVNVFESGMHLAVAFVAIATGIATLTI